ncbi:hypothetical protein GW17_00013630 [Ensete ventricosum]|nr:hypothetical protein GW17_00013630 [Ensete ventricosum]RZR83985.1 hypothetical protein BHM03_00010718 [Ensete ventricosum]
MRCLSYPKAVGSDDSNKRLDVVAPTVAGIKTPWVSNSFLLPHLRKGGVDRSLTDRRRLNLSCPTCGHEFVALTPNRYWRLFNDPGFSPPVANSHSQSSRPRLFLASLIKSKRWQG